jgi:carbamoyl-phosphate synthase large subunit
VLVMGAGTAGAENLLASLRAGKTRLALFGCHHDPFVLRNSTAAVRLLVPPTAARGFAAALAALVRSRKIDLVIPTNDVHVLALSRARRRLARKLFLPSSRLIELCQDKYRLAQALRAHGLPAPRTVAVPGLGAIGDLFARLGGGPLWCRPRAGSCARGGGKVETAAAARRWIEIWHSMQGIPPRRFTLCEYLPGREILCQSVWKEGRMAVADTYERLAYFGTDNIPSGVTSFSSLAKTVREPAVVDLCRETIRRLSPRASGAFSIDIKEDARGNPRITEINAGRLFLSMTIFDPVLKHNLSLTYAEVALGRDVRLRDDYDPTEDYYIVRDMDVLPALFHAEDLFEGIEAGRQKGEPWEWVRRTTKKATKSRSSSKAR